MLTHTLPLVSVICSLVSLQHTHNLPFPFALFHNFTIIAPVTINDSQCIYYYWLQWLSQYLRLFHRRTQRRLWDVVKISRGITSQSFKYNNTQLMTLRHCRTRMGNNASWKVFLGFPCERLRSQQLLAPRGRCVSDVVRRG